MMNKFLPTTCFVLLLFFSIFAFSKTIPSDWVKGTLKLKNGTQISVYATRADVLKLFHKPSGTLATDEIVDVTAISTGADDITSARTGSINFYP